MSLRTPRSTLFPYTTLFRSAGCSLAATVGPEDVRAWRAQHREGMVVAYVNCSAAVKAEADYCCTSGNAVAVINALPRSEEHTSELQSHSDLVCRLLLEKKKK